MQILQNFSPTLRKPANKFLFMFFIYFLFWFFYSIWIFVINSKNIFAFFTCNLFSDKHSPNKNFFKLCWGVLNFFMLVLSTDLFLPTKVSFYFILPFTKKTDLMEINVLNNSNYTLFEFKTTFTPKQTDKIFKNHILSRAKNQFSLTPVALVS